MNFVYVDCVVYIQIVKILIALIRIIVIALNFTLFHTSEIGISEVFLFQMRASDSQKYDYSPI